jgi:hypothetical protein
MQHECESKNNAYRMLVEELEGNRPLGESKSSRSGGMQGNAYLMTFRTGIFRSWAVACPPWFAKRVALSVQGTTKSHSERDPENTMVGWWQECLSRRRIGSQQAKCGSVRCNGAETTVQAVWTRAPNRPCQFREHFDWPSYNGHSDNVLFVLRNFGMWAQVKAAVA